MIYPVPHKHQTNMSFCFAPEVASGSVSGAEIRVKRPTVGILENNRTLGKQNIEAIIEILNEAGVFVKQFGAEASDYRSPSRRNRNYFITIAVGAVKIDQNADDFIEPAFVQRFVKVLAQQKLGPGLAASIMLPVQEDAAGMYTPEDLVDSLSLKRQLVDDKPDDEPAWRSHHLGTDGVATKLRRRGACCLSCSHQALVGEDAAELFLLLVPSDR